MSLSFLVNLFEPADSFLTLRGCSDPYVCIPWAASRYNLTARVFRQRLVTVDIELFFGGGKALRSFKRLSRILFHDFCALTSDFFPSLGVKVRSQRSVAAYLPY